MYEKIKAIHKENMSLMYEAFREIGKPIFIIGGTALGYLRDNDFIDGDKDVDFGIFAEDFTEDILKVIESKGITLDYRFGLTETCMQLAFSRKGIHIDIHPFYKFGEERFHYSFVDGEYGWDMPDMIRFKYRDFNLEEVNFLGVKVLIPEDLETSYIIPHYGKDWNIKKEAHKQWFYYKDPPNLEIMKMRMPKIIVNKK